MKPFRFVDLFCGGGGSITGEIAALKEAGIAYDGRGFNHWDLAIRTIQANHPEIVPDFERACADICEVSGSPQSVFDDDPMRLDLLWASPSCTHHSNAAGGIPRSEQLRSQPWSVLPFLTLTKCRRMFVENVEELLSWGPVLDRDTTYKGRTYHAGQADPRLAGKLFHDWINAIRHSGYAVDWQLMNAADYGAATSRTRLIVQAVRKSSGEKIVWPEPTHVREPGMFGGKPWRSAAEIIDWSIPGKSIIDRDNPLCENTIRRIKRGIWKYWGKWAKPFIHALNHADCRMEVPLSAMPPFLTVIRGTGNSQINSSSRSLTDPLPTITTGGDHMALISPFLTRYNGGEERNHSIGDPVPVIDCSNRYGLISPLMIPQQSAGSVKPCAGNPLPTVATSGAIGVTMPFLMSYYSKGTVTETARPVPTITTKDRFGLVQGRILTLPDGQRFKLDITHRMLTARELAAATGFPDGYVFVGGDTAAKKMIGNAVCPDLAAALIRAILAA